VTKLPLLGGKAIITTISLILRCVIGILPVLEAEGLRLKSFLQGLNPFCLAPERCG
jgi:hypothetical protein